MSIISGVTYGNISKQIEQLEYQTVFINQIFCNKKYLGLIKEFQEEGIVIVSDTNKDDRIKALLIK